GREPPGGAAARERADAADLERFLPVRGRRAHKQDRSENTCPPPRLHRVLSRFPRKVSRAAATRPPLLRTSQLADATRVRQATRGCRSEGAAGRYFTPAQAL